MPTNILINNISGSTPFNVYLCDEFNVTCTYIDTIPSSALPYTFQVPSVMEGQVSFNIKVIDNNSCTSISNIILNSTPSNPCPDCVAQDIIIGTQTWSKCNLDVTTYRNGDIIPQVTDPSVWTGLTTGAWCYYNNDSVTGDTYGKLYNWYAVNDPRVLAPTGYHVPTDEEWTILTDYLYEPIAGGKLKESGLCHWLTPNTGATNETGFTGLPGGQRQEDDGSFTDIGSIGYWWSSSENLSSTTRAWNRSLYFNGEFVGISSFNYKTTGFSVRVIKED